MPETDPTAIQILLSTAIALLALLVVICWRIARRISRIERRLAEAAGHQETLLPTTPSDIEIPAGGAFESFLEEAPSCRSMPKAEQFAAYRKWRQEKGLNWSGS